MATKKDFDIMAALGNSMQGNPEEASYVYRPAEPGVPAVDLTRKTPISPGVKKEVIKVGLDMPAEIQSGGSSDLSYSDRVKRSAISFPQFQFNEPQMPVASPSPATQPAMSEVSPQREPAGMNFDWGDILVGATPVLTGLIMGEPNVGFKYGGQGLIKRYDEGVKAEEDARKLAAKVKAMQVETSKRGRYQARPYEDENGITRLGTFDTAEGVWISGDSPDRVAGYKQGLREDPTTGELIKYTGSGNIEDIRGTKPKPFTVKQQEEMADLRTKMVADPKFKAARTSVDASGRALSLLEAGNPVADEGLKTVFPRMFGEVGNLAAAEQERFSGSPSFPRRFEKLKQKFLNGTLTDADRRDLMEVARVMMNYSRYALNQVAGSYAASEEAFRGYSPSPALDPFVKEANQPPAATVKQSKKQAPTYGKPEEKYIDRGKTRYIYKLNPQGKYVPDRTERIK